ncbi:MAG: hypothetical protein EAX96_17650 [Candidatus Lokiarchaeota archaeon]|nr:hypothetical protein [Candidatus Lokiarchaeota archaeon]
MKEGFSKLCNNCKKKNTCEYKNADIFSCIKKEPLNEPEKLILNFLRNIQNESEKNKLKDFQLLRSLVQFMFDIL